MCSCKIRISGMILYHTFSLRLPVRPAMTVDIFRDCHVATLLAMTVSVFLVMTVKVRYSQ